jgi:hypothetical protein
MTLSQPWFPVASRVAAAVLGGYLFTWGLSALIVASNLAAGGDYDEGLTLAYLVAFLAYLTAFLWAFAAKSLTRVWCVLAGGGAAMTGAAWALTQAFGLQH